jgi:hypothetical protein
MPDKIEEAIDQLIEAEEQMYLPLDRSSKAKQRSAEKRLAVNAVLSKGLDELEQSLKLAIQQYEELSDVSVDKRFGKVRFYDNQGLAIVTFALNDAWVEDEAKREDVFGSQEVFRYYHPRYSVFTIEIRFWPEAAKPYVMNDRFVFSSANECAKDVVRKYVSILKEKV